MSGRLEISMLPRMSAWARTWASVGVAAVLLAAGGCGGPAPGEANVVQPVAPPVAPVEPAPAMPALPQGVDVPGLAPAQAKPPAAPVPEAPAPEVKPAQVVELPAADKRKTTTPTTTTPAATKVEAVKPVPVTPVAKGEPAPAPKSAPAPAPAAKTHVTVPRTAHVRVEIPAGMQALLDDDPRMQPWVDKAMAIIEVCYASKGGGTSATMSGVVTMHKDARPDVDVTSLPPSLAGVVACATGDLMRNRMPLFSGPEGQRHTLKVRFSP